MEAFARAQIARQNGARSRVFDWKKAARLIAERHPKWAMAGLALDMEDTGGYIWEDGKIVTDDYTFLKSNWAEPILIMSDYEDNPISCWVYADETDWDAKTKWPYEAFIELHKVLVDEQKEEILKEDNCKPVSDG